MKELINQIISKKELTNLPEKIVEEKIKKYLTKEGKTKYEKLGTRFFRTSAFKELKKKVRSELREIYGVFFQTKTDRKKFLKELLKNPSIDNHLKILELHQSSKERLPFYDTVYSKIFSITGKPNTILDLACGYNPFSYPFMKEHPKIIGVDISIKDAEFLQEFMDKTGIDGTAVALDLTKEESLSQINKWNVDVCFLFKALDSIESVKRHWSSKLLESINAKYVVVSFPTKSIGGKKEIRTSKRNWFEKSQKIIEKFEIPNEAFYIIKNMS